MGTRGQDVGRQNYLEVLERERAEVKPKEDLRLDWQKL
jgi:hypothetical protein